MRRFHHTIACEQFFASTGVDPEGVNPEPCGRRAAASCELCGMELCGDCLLLPCLANESPNGEHRPIGLGELERTA